MEDVYGTALGRTFYQGNGQAGISVQLRLLILTKGFSHRILKEALPMRRCLRSRVILTEEEKEAITEGLTGIRRDVEEGRLVITEEYEDIHSLWKQT